MNTQHLLSNTVLLLTNLPEELADIQNDMANNTRRLHYLLYAKDRKRSYEGPFYNRLNAIDWVGITELVIGWIIETLYKCNKKCYNKNVHKLFYEYSFTNVGVQLMSLLLHNNVFDITDTAKVVGLLHDKHTLQHLNNKIEDIIEEIDTFSYWNKKKNIKKLVDNIGNACTHLNALQTVEELDIEPMLLESILREDTPSAKYDVSLAKDETTIVHEIIDDIIDQISSTSENSQ